MAILFMDGMDLHGVTANLIRRYSSIAATNIAYLSTSGRFGGGGIRVNDDDKFFTVSTPSNPQTIIVSFAVFRTITGPASDTVFKILNAAANNFNFTEIGGTDTINVRLGGSVKGSFTLPVGVWNYLSIKLKVANTGGTIDVELNGTNVMTFSGDTNEGGNEFVDTVSFGGDVVQDWTYDDIIITDDAGSAPFNTLLADRRIETILPNATGDSAGFTANPAVDNFLNVDEASPDDDTTFVESDTSTTKDLYNMTALGFSPASIDAVNVVALATNPDAGTTQFKHKVKSGTTEGTGLAKSPPLGYTVFDEIFLNNPDTAAAWTESEINTMQAGMEIAG